MKRVTEKRVRLGNFRVGVGGYLGLKVINRAGQVVRQGKFKNLITNWGMNRIAEDVDIGRWIRLGDVDSAPSEGQLSLMNQTLAKLGPSWPTFVEGDPGEWDFQRTRDFDFGEATGSYKEWGMAPTELGNIATRALFLDELDNPTTIEVTDDEFLSATWGLHVQLSPTTTPGDGTVDITGMSPETRDIEWRFVRPGGIWEVFGLQRLINKDTMYATPKADGLPGYTEQLNFEDGDYNKAVPYSPYVPSSHERELGEVIWEMEEANFTIKTIILHSHTGGGGVSAMYACTFKDGHEIAKDDEHRLRLTLPKISWERL